MNERVLFEFRARCTQDGYHYEFKHGSEEYTFISPTLCTPRRIPSFARRRKPAFTHRIEERSRQRMRQTLDFLENLYNDLYPD